MVKTKLYLLILATNLQALLAAAQPLPDSVKLKYNAAQTASERGQHLTDYLGKMRGSDDFQQLTAALKKYFTEKNDASAFDYVKMSELGNLAKTGEYATALEEGFQLLARFEQRKDMFGMICAYDMIGQSYYFSGNIEQSLEYSKKGIPLAIATGDHRGLGAIYNNIGSTYAGIQQPDSAIMYTLKSLAISEQLNDRRNQVISLTSLGESYMAAKNYEAARQALRQALNISASTSTDVYNSTWLTNDMAHFFLETRDYDSAAYFARQAVSLTYKKGYKDQLQRAYDYLYQAYDGLSRQDSAYKYFKLSVAARDSLFSMKKTQEIQGISFREQLRLKEVEQEKIRYRSQLKLYALAAGLLAFGVIAFILIRNNRQKQKANRLLQQQKEKLESTLAELRMTQQQLIQSEKMASLGELTAGIAHEIQNPLNFVNNFSEINQELLEEMNAEIANGNYTAVKEIAADISENEGKIKHHGKRADSIVKGMLQHSRSSSATKEPTDINKLADEYLRLAYHGLRAKDKTFNATLKTEYDEALAHISVIPQDIGRVVLNLITNAFYAVTEKLAAARAEGDTSYLPTVIISTGTRHGHAEIRVTDNGNGIPASIVDKIFQPFFTTKPTGQGTGLGLSMSYDIVTKGHGGELKVETKENQGTTFTIILPLTKITKP